MSSTRTQHTHDISGPRKSYFHNRAPAATTASSGKQIAHLLARFALLSIRPEHASSL